MKSADFRRWRRCAASAILVVAFLASSGSGAHIDCTAPNGQDSFIIASQEAADALSNCTKVAGNIVIQANDLTQITLDGIEVIEGNLDGSSGDGLQEISAPSLAQITNNFTLSSLPHLTSLDFPLLDNINGGIYWDTLPGLANVSFGALKFSPYGLPGANVDGDISISGTALDSLAFLNFTHYSNPDLIWIKDNQQLYNVNLTGLSWGSNSLAIANNGPSAQIFLPNLRSAGAITIAAAARIDVSSLSEISTDVIISNNSIDLFAAPNLTTVGGNFIISNNYLLADLDLPLVTTIGDGSGNGDFVVVNNTALDTITHLNQLVHAQGNISLSGNFSDVTLPNLRAILGGFHLNSSNPALDCTAFDKLAHDTSANLTPSFYSCGAYLPGETKDVAKHHKVSNKSLHLSKPVKAIIIIISVIAGLLLCGLLLQWIERKRRRRGSDVEEVVDLSSVGSGRSTASGGGVTRHEEGDELPEYRRVGKKGEVPPGYVESVSENRGTDQVAAGNANTGAADAGEMEITVE